MFKIRSLGLVRGPLFTDSQVLNQASTFQLIFERKKMKVIPNKRLWLFPDEPIDDFVSDQRRVEADATRNDATRNDATLTSKKQLLNYFRNGCKFVECQISDWMIANKFQDSIAATRAGTGQDPRAQKPVNKFGLVVHYLKAL